MTGFDHLSSAVLSWPWDGFEDLQHAALCASTIVIPVVDILTVDGIAQKLHRIVLSRASVAGLYRSHRAPTNSVWAGEMNAVSVVIPGKISLCPASADEVRGCHWWDSMTGSSYLEL